MSVTITIDENSAAAAAQSAAEAAAALAAVEGLVTSLEGSIVFNTLSLAQAAYAAADPKPANGIVFYVSVEHDPDNAGKYTWQSDQPGGTRLEGPIVDLTDKIEDSTKAIESRAVLKFKGDLGTVITLVDPIPFVLQSGEINTTTGIPNSSLNWLTTQWIDVEPNTQYTIKGFAVSASAISKRVLFKSEANVITVLTGGSTTDPFTFVTPVDCAQIAFSVAAGTNVGASPSTSPHNESFVFVKGDVLSTHLQAEKIEGNIQTPQISVIEANIALFNSILSAEYIQLQGSFTLGAITTSGLTSVTDGAAAYKRTSLTSISSMFHVQPGEIHTYTGEIDSSTYAGVTYLNSSFVKLGHQCTEVMVYDKYELTLPEGTVYIASCSKTVNPIIEIKNLFASARSSRNIFYVDASFEGESDGTVEAPFANINDAISQLAQHSSGKIIIAGGTYRETLNLAILLSGDYEILGKEGNRVRILGSNQLTGWTLTEGQTNVYEIPFSGTVSAWSRFANPIFEDGNPSKPIDPDEYHPLQKNHTHRLPFTPIYQVLDVAAVASTPGSYCIDDGKMYLHTTNSDNPATNGFSYENIVRTANTFNSASSTNHKVNLTLHNLQFFFTTGGFVAIGFSKMVRRFCVSMACLGAGAWRNDTGYIETYYEEAAFCNNDGENSHFSSFTGSELLSDNRSNYPTVKHVGLWTHDNGDDGESSHEQHNIYMDGILSEYNGDSGCRPSNDATYYVKNGIFRYNGWEVGHVGSPGKGEGFAVVNPNFNSVRLGCRALLYNCLSYGNNTGYGTISDDDNVLELHNCVARNNILAEYYAGQGKIIARNCKVTNADPAKIKVTVTGTIEVINDNNLL